MEIMVYNYFEEKARSGERAPASKSELVYDFINTLPQRIKGRAIEPVYNEAVDRNMTPSKREEAVRKAVQIRRQIIESNRLVEKGDPEGATKELQSIFGDRFN